MAWSALPALALVAMVVMVTPGANAGKIKRDDIIYRILNVHNKERCNVEPPARDMTTMKWDPDLAWTANKVAKKCVFEHSEFEYRAKKYKKRTGEDALIGESLALGNLGGINRKKYAKIFSKAWADEKEDWDFHALTMDDFAPDSPQVGHYTQMIDADSEYVGCAFKSCDNNQRLFVCHYRTAGNVLGQTPYEPCEDDEDCANPACDFGN
ncbi:uncharacterized protein MONBRDRAFT_30348 [Monosiga brevicollis MX1]|uniref:SCP domain-containing protein n=1 Tax=Monosiga brevicollis TaxID=81824 RepID=A9VDQ4_MONBE|nr:uncharacterized protein MONBRDRAFT_30348 [Monosiga brevicollis MX1]EDQ84342.1 predicted protein [Monosiga brevicollis MX1]|eukprot:XP_001750838.1 hypothetical protein [Monosiga brevicollis MX1]